MEIVQDRDGGDENDPRNEGAWLTVRGYWEMAEAVHPGPMRQYCAELRAYLANLETQVGADEHMCEVCGVRNVSPDGTARVFFWGMRGRWFCENHKPDFDAMK